MSASEILKPFIEALNLEKLRLEPAQRFIFFCGGKLSTPPAPPASLRDYLRRRIPKVKKTHFVFAESATALFRDSGYSDLIQFEADIAQISELVLLIAESVGSLTELGAFAMHEHIVERLQVFISDEYYNAESFIRHGPIRLLNDKHNAVSYYPWRTYMDGRLKVKSIKSDVRDIKRDIVAKLASLDQSEALQLKSPRHIMIVTFWCIYVLRGATAPEIAECLALFGIGVDSNVVKKYLYCMRVAGWIEETQYQHTVWYYCLVDIDPIQYAFRPGAVHQNSLRWKSDTAESLKRSIVKRPRPVVEAMGKP